MAEGQNVCSENKEIRETMRQMRVAPYIQMISHLQTA